MADPTPRHTPTFAEPTPARSFPATAVGIAVIALLLLAGTFAMLGRRHAANASLSAAYAPNLAITGVKMSEADSRDGFGKLMYIEGHVENRGSATVTGVRVEVALGNDAGPAQREVAPMNVIYLREPYIDTRPVSAAAPLGPGAGADFRLILDDVKDSWNQQTPTLRVAGVWTK